MEKHKTTILKSVIHLETENPVFGKTNLFVEIDDESAGPFISLSSNEIDSYALKIDIEELELITTTARKMIDDYNKNKF